MSPAATLPAQGQGLERWRRRRGASVLDLWVMQGLSYGSVLGALALTLLGGLPAVGFGRASASSPKPSSVPVGPSYQAPKQAPAYGGTWMSVAVGGVGQAMVTMGDPSELADVGALQETGELPKLLELHSEGPGARFALALHHRFRRVDLGLSLIHQSGQDVELFERTRRTPSQLQLEAFFRWRYVERHWGALYSGVALGGFLSTQSDGLRASVAFHFEGAPQLATTDPRFGGVGVAGILGVAFYRGEGLGFFVEFINHVSMTDYRVQDRDLPTLFIHPSFNAGVTWSL